jgi:hypothetical protein
MFLSKIHDKTVSVCPMFHSFPLPPIIFLFICVIVNGFILPKKIKSRFFKLSRFQSMKNVKSLVFLFFKASKNRELKVFRNQGFEVSRYQGLRILRFQGFKKSG